MTERFLKIVQIIMVVNEETWVNIEVVKLRSAKPVFKIFP